MNRKFLEKAFLLSALLLAISSCATYGGDFDCKYGQGEGCKSISKVNAIINSGNLKSSKTDLRIWVAPVAGELEGYYEYIDSEEVK
jgi:hypothetical protein